jgi:hypothetical protein
MDAESDTQERTESAPTPLTSTESNYSLETNPGQSTSVTGTQGRIAIPRLILNNSPRLRLRVAPRLRDPPRTPSPSDTVAPRLRDPPPTPSRSDSYSFLVQNAQVNQLPHLMPLNAMQMGLSESPMQFLQNSVITRELSTSRAIESLQDLIGSARNEIRRCSRTLDAIDARTEEIYDAYRSLEEAEDRRSQQEEEID